jgi:hypothetical protein
MKRIAALSCLLALALPACIWGAPTPPKTQLEIREFQTRDFDTKDQKLVIKALLNALQDDGFTVKNADAELGFLSATKEIDLGDGGIAWSFGTTGHHEAARWRKLKVIDATANVTAFGAQTRVRVSFQEKIIDNLGAVMGASRIDDPKFYQDFFAKVDKGVFLQKEKL